MATRSNSAHTMTDDDVRHMASRLVELRRVNKLKMTEAARKLGVKPNGQQFSPTYWGTLEHGKLCMSQLFHDMVCDAFGVTTEWLLGEGKTRDDLPRGVPNAHSFNKSGNGDTERGPVQNPPGYIAPRSTNPDEQETTGERIRRETSDEVVQAHTPATEIPVYLQYKPDINTLYVTVAGDVKVIARRLGTPTIVKGS